MRMVPVHDSQQERTIRTTNAREQSIQMAGAKPCRVQPVHLRRTVRPAIGTTVRR